MIRDLRFEIGAYHWAYQIDGADAAVDADDFMAVNRNLMYNVTAAFE